MWKGLTGENWHTGQNGQDVAEAAFWTAYFAALAYQNSEDPEYQAEINAGAFYWEIAAADLNGLDNDYCYFMGVGEQCAPSDGIVPVAAQSYPGAENRSISGPSHIEETRSSQLNVQLQDIFDNRFVIPRRPPADIVTIHGPTSMRPGNRCYWYASTNFENSYFQWQVNGEVVGTSSDLWYSASSDFTLELQAWNDGGHGGNTSESISVSYANGDCLQERPVGSKSIQLPIGSPRPDSGQRPARAP